MDRDAFASLFSRQQHNKNNSGAARISSSSSHAAKSPRAGRASPPATKRRAGSKRSRSTDEGSRFVECPLCGRSIHCSLAQAHVDRCVGGEKNTGQSSPTLSVTTAGTAAPSCSRQNEPSLLSAVAVCGVSPDPQRPLPWVAQGGTPAATANAAAGTTGTSEAARLLALEVSPSPPLSEGVSAAVKVPVGADEVGPRDGSSMPNPYPTAAAAAAATTAVSAASAAGATAATTATTATAAGPAPAITATAAPAIAAAATTATADEEPISCLRVSSVNALDPTSQRWLGLKRNNAGGDQDPGADSPSVKPLGPSVFSNDNNNTDTDTDTTNSNTTTANTTKTAKTAKITKTTNTTAQKAAAPTPSNKNAFSKLMAASALTNFREEMYLWGHQDGTLSWGWGAAGAPLPFPPTQPPPPSNTASGGRDDCGASAVEIRGWSCQVATKGPEGRKAGMCEIWTNIPSEGSACAPSPPPGVGLGEARSASVSGPARRGGGGGGGGGAGAATSTGRDDNSGLKAVHPSRSLSRLSVPVVKSMLQKNVRRGRAEAAARCALELGLKSWSDAIRRVLVIIVEDSLLHPAVPLLAWLMVATSKGYRPPPLLLDAFLRVVYETAACPVRDTSDSCFLFRSNGSGDALGGDGNLPASFTADEFAAPHPKDLIFRASQREARRPSTSSLDGAEFSAKQRPLSAAMLAGHEKRGGAGGVEDASAPERARTGFSRPVPPRKERGGEAGPGFFAENSGCASAAETAAATAIGAPAGDATKGATADEADAAIACCRRSLLMRASYGGMAFDQALLKGACLAWGERSGHCTPSPATASDRAAFSSGGSSSSGGSGSGSGGGGGGSGGGGDGGLGDGADKGKLRPPPLPPSPPTSKAAAATAAAARGGATPFGYVRGKVVSSWEKGEWIGFLAAAHAGAGMPEALRWKLMEHVVGGDGSGGRLWSMDGTKRALGAECLGKGEAGGRPRERAGDGERGASGTFAVAAEVAGAGGLAAVTATVATTDTKNAGVAAAAGAKNAAAAAVAQRQRTPILREEDAILSGVDFHCSRVLDELLRSPALAARVGKAAASSRRFGDPGVGVKEAAKQAMWTCSSGLNVRSFQLAFSPGGRGVDGGKMSGRKGSRASGPLAYLAETQAEAVGVGVSETDAKVWATLSPDVLEWTRRFVRGKLAPGAMKKNL